MGEPKCFVSVGTSGDIVSVPSSSLLCPATQKKAGKAILFVQLTIFFLFLFVSVLIGLAISSAVIQLQNGNPSVSYGTNVTVIVFASLSAVLLIMVSIATSKGFNDLFQVIQDQTRNLGTNTTA